MKKDAAITTGQLPNGISYYLVTNSSMKGLADFALVRKGCADTLAARGELSKLPHFNKTIPYKFLSRKGIGCRPEGYISYRDGSTMFRFDDVPVFDQAASDTTLLMLFDLIASKPTPHAVIVAGDITPADIIDKMKVFALMVPSRNPKYKKPAYSFTDGEEPVYSFTPSNKTSVTVDFRAQRTADDRMGTILPFMSELFSSELAEILRTRLKDSFMERKIAVSDYSVSYLGSAQTLGDEHFTASARTSQSQIIQATLALSSIISETAARGVESEEYRTARETVLKKMAQQQTNDELVRRCISSYLTGSDLASTATKAQYFSSRNMSFDSELKLFNNYVKALIGDLGNMKVTWAGKAEEYDDWTYPVVFMSAWKSVSMLDNSTFQWTTSPADSAEFWSSKNKTKIKSIAQEPVSGGEMWTFSNGLKVIYKKLTGNSGQFNYSLMIKGGSAAAKDIRRGEGAFYSDILSLYEVSGLSGSDFDRILRVNGIQMNCNVSPSDIRLSGSASTGELSLVLRALLSVANQRSTDRTAFGRYKNFELAGLQPAVLDSLMFPDNKFTEVKTPSGLTDHTLVTADECFSNQFVRVNDGVLVLVGDLSYETVQKTLCSYLGGFRVSKGVQTRPSVSYTLRTGTSTYTKDGDFNQIQIGLAASQPFTPENYMAFRIACLALQRRLTGVMAENGFSMKMENQFDTYPVETMKIVFTCTPVPGCGLPEGIECGATHASEVLAEARKATESVFATPIGDAELNACKSLLTNSYAAYLADPSSYVDAILMRYSNGKDIITNYKDRIGSVKADNVKTIFSALSEGMRIEYVVKEK